MSEALLERIASLEAEIERLKRGAFEPSGTVVEVPPESRALFDQAASTLHRYFTRVEVDPARAKIAIEDERYVLIRASALSVNFLDALAHLYADRGEREALAIGRGLLFDLAHTIGIHDARTMHEKLGHEEPMEKLSAGPVHFAYTGWAKVDIKPESHPSPDDDFCLVYEHPYSFEADSFIRAKRTTEGPVCIMGSGYSSGWCEESFGIQLTAVEVTCRARGDRACAFVMAPPHRIRDRVREHFDIDVEGLGAKGFDVPTYFERKRAEETVQQTLRRLKEAQDELVRKERLAAVGLLVASVAHEINTPLGIAVTAMSVVNDELLELESKFSGNRLSKKDLRVFLEQAFEASTLVAANLDRAAVQVSNFRRASVDQVSNELVEIDLVAYVRQTLENLKPIARHGQLDVSFRCDEPRITAFTQPGAIAQLLTNFLTNSATHGRNPDESRRLAVTVSLSLVADDARDDRSSIRLVYEDDGRGMSEEIRQQAFQPFFTTARTSGGTGLGLHIVQSLVSDVLRGKMRLETSPGAGVRFDIELPLRVEPT
jgi:two-component system, cell cycle sensor histidine kinase and response regulator CckA